MKVSCVPICGRHQIRIYSSPKMCSIHVDWFCFEQGWELHVAWCTKAKNGTNHGTKPQGWRVTHTNLSFLELNQTSLRLAGTCFSPGSE
mmetsp:Transcript_151199/g.264204  ORF Transcript_151199/g.264204 Transcript_151199/m.264204 type:complete len:89 (-) Transcript_151199:113-379(-)